MQDSEDIYLIIKASDDDYRETVAAFSGPDGRIRAGQVKRLKAMADEAESGTYAASYHVELIKTNQTNVQLGLGAPLREIDTNPFIQAAIADLFTVGTSIVPAWLDVDWLRTALIEETKESIRADGQVLYLNDGSRDDGFVETVQH